VQATAQLLRGVGRRLRSRRLRIRRLRSLSRRSIVTPKAKRIQEVISSRIATVHINL